MVSGVLFDVDGTLVDTTYLHAVTWWGALRQAGHDVPMSRIHPAIGMGADKILDFLLGSDRDRSNDEAMTAGHSSRYGDYWTRLRPLPGATDLIRACVDRGLQVVLATSASQEELAALRAALGADEFITAATSADDASESKPAPDILEVALHKSGLKAHEVAFVGDSIWDVHAANRLEIPCVALTCGGTCERDLREAGAIAIYSNPKELLAKLNESPLST
ncbi:MAG: HAD family hydrolase [Longispora sp.]|nr:HAD family hydrolase [Longispora sp. (in: high G+C Gram-positive bacteria)]